MKWQGGTAVPPLWKIKKKKKIKTKNRGKRKRKLRRAKSEERRAKSLPRSLLLLPACLLASCLASGLPTSTSYLRRSCPCLPSATGHRHHTVRLWTLIFECWFCRLFFTRFDADFDNWYWFSISRDLDVLNQMVKNSMAYWSYWLLMGSWDGLNSWCLPN